MVQSNKAYDDVNQQYSPCDGTWPRLVTAGAGLFCLENAPLI